MTKLGTIETTMTLKEITDLLDVEHNKAMKTVAKMAETKGFGLVAKITTKQKVGFGERNIETYQLNRRQSMAVAAKLNTELLMNVIDRLDELESGKARLPNNYKDALKALVVEVEQNERLAIENENQRHALAIKDEYIVVSNEASIKAGEILVREFAKSIDFIEVGQNRIFKWLRESGFIMEGNEPYQQYVKLGWFTWKPSKEEHGGKIRYSLRITPRGKLKLAQRYMDYIEGGASEVAA